MFSLVIPASRSLLIICLSYLYYYVVVPGDTIVTTLNTQARERFADLVTGDPRRGALLAKKRVVQEVPHVAYGAVRRARSGEAGGHTA